MKRVKKTVALFCAVGIFSTSIISCQKEILKPGQETSSYNLGTSIKSENGMLIFSSQEELYKTINYLNKLSSQERISWGESHQVKTLQMIEDQIGIDQSEFEREYYKGIEEGLSLEELELTGKPAAFCNSYKEYLSKGIITEKVEDDGFYSFHLTLQSPDLVYIANEDGCYIVNDTIFMRTNDYLAAKPYEGTQDVALLRNAQPNSKSGILYFDMSSSSKSIHEFYYDNIFGSHGTLTDPNWYYEDSHHRFKHYVNFKSTISGSLTFMTTTFYTEARAESRPFWSWNKDKHWESANDYNPIDYIGGQWSYSYKILNWDTGFGTYHDNDLPSSGASSPFSLNPAGTTNLLGASLNPNGIHSVSSPYGFDVPVFIEAGSMRIYGYFPGITGTYSTNYTN